MLLHLNQRLRQLKTVGWHLDIEKKQIKGFAFAMAIAVLSVNSTCCFTAYQPDVPESLDRN
ncbi:cyclic lactone autoinducer peptide [Lacticaseibacillus rhamnosus]|nr:cyclic lactone autoinducer peptide [Lacticaseibacillus rhamnosus]MSC22278.1 cyclic lactone autoinducer peptide [Lacticaseibacillus rhamnosus]